MDSVIIVQIHDIFHSFISLDHKNDNNQWGLGKLLICLLGIKTK